MLPQPTSSLFKTWIVCSILLKYTTVFAEGAMPQQVENAAKNRFPQGKILKAEPETHQGKEVYEVKIQDGEVVHRLLITGNSEILHDEEETELSIIGGSLSLGLAVRSETALYRGTDGKVQLEPALIYRNGGFQLQAYDGVNVSYDFYNDHGFTFAVYGEMATEGFATGDSHFLAGMTEPDITFSMGLAATYRTAFAEVELLAANDVSGEHNGQEIKLSVKKSCALYGAEITPKLTLSYMSEQVTDYYFGVSHLESRADRLAYSPDDALNLEAGLLISYPLTERFALIGMLENTWLSKAITDSPIVEEKYQFSATIGVLYTF